MRSLDIKKPNYLKYLYADLGIKRCIPIFIHNQMGLMERMNQTLKAMLKNSCGGGDGGVPHQ